MVCCRLPLIETESSSLTSGRCDLRQFDVEARKLEPDLFISGLLPLPNLELSSPALTGRQITKNGVKSYELSDLKISGPINDFTLSMMCMPRLEEEIVIDNNLFKLELLDLYRYRITAGNSEQLIPFDHTCHHISISRKGRSLSISISDRRIEIVVAEDPIEEMVMFSGPGAILVDKLVFSTTNEVPPSTHYDALMPRGDLTRISEESFIEWIFADEIEHGRVFSGENAHVIDGKYIMPLVNPGISGASLRNLSQSLIEISYDRGQTWLDIGGLEKIPASMDSALIRSDRMNFEFVLDNYETESIRLPGVSAKITGTVHPYHRDERTYYTNATYDFSNASVTLTPIENEMPKSIWIYGKLSPALVDSISTTFIYKDGILLDEDVIFDTTNHLYLIGIPNQELVLNPEFDSFIGINAIGVSEIDGSDPGMVKKVFDLFAGNTVVGYAEEVPSLTGGRIGSTDQSFRVIDVQWTI